MKGSVKMKKYEESFSEKSVWITQTPTLATANLPFFVTESGHFYAESDYAVNRDFHDSFLFLYTLNGSGRIKSSDETITLPENSAVLIDCHKFHSYSSVSPMWEFIWLHIKGSGIEAMFNLIYPEQISAIDVSNALTPTVCDELLKKRSQSDLLTSVQASLHLHNILNTLLKCRLSSEQSKINNRYADFVNQATKLIREGYSQPLTIDDILKNIPLSKYHFIRIFKQIMGVTPYHYLTNYRINTAKILLRSEDISISEAAERCGFADTSNFINQFKKHTGQKPLEYKRYFL